MTEAADRGPSLISIESATPAALLVVGVAYAVAGVGEGIGTPSATGAGFFPLLVAAVLIPAIGATLGLVTTLGVALVAIAKIMGLGGGRAPVLLLGLTFAAATRLIFVRWLYVSLPAGALGLV